jgi:hypothetical protein
MFDCIFLTIVIKLDLNENVNFNEIKSRGPDSKIIKVYQLLTQKHVLELISHCQVVLDVKCHCMTNMIRVLFHLNLIQVSRLIVTLMV